MDKYIEIKNLTDPQKTFKALENEFIDIMYPDHIYQGGLIMLLDVNIDPEKEKDIAWLKELLDYVLPQIGETKYSLEPFKPKK